MVNWTCYVLILIGWKLFAHVSVLLLKDPSYPTFIASRLATVDNIAAELARADPCSDHLETNDTTILTANKPTDVAAISCHSFIPFKWYRYTGTGDGLLTHVCPEGLQCGSHSQIWINDSFPTVDQGEHNTRVCIRTEASCCFFKNTVKMKNCSDFMVYFFVPTPHRCVNYCFYSPPDMDQVKGGDSGGGIRNTQNKLILPVTLGVLGGLVLLGIIVFIAYRVYHNKTKKRKPEEQMSDTVKNAKFTG